MFVHYAKYMYMSNNVHTTYHTVPHNTHSHRRSTTQRPPLLKTKSFHKIGKIVFSHKLEREERRRGGGGGGGGREEEEEEEEEEGYNMKKVMRLHLGFFKAS